MSDDMDAARRSKTSKKPGSERKGFSLCGVTTVWFLDMFNVSQQSSAACLLDTPSRFGRSTSGLSYTSQQFSFFRYHGHPSHRKVRCRKCVRRSISSIYMRKVLPFAQQNRLHKCLQRSNLLQRHIFMSSYTVYIYTIACILFCFQRVSLGKCNDTGC